MSKVAVVNTAATILSNSFLAACVNVASTVKVSRPESKMEKCRSFFFSNPGLARKDYIKVFVNEYGATPDGAATYHYNLTKEAKQKVLEQKVADTTELDAELEVDVDSIEE